MKRIIITSVTSFLFAASALAQTPAPPPNLITPPTLDPSPQIAASVARQINSEINRRAQTTISLWNMVWNSKSATPDQVVAALGKQAGLVFNLAAENVAHLTRAASLAGQPLNVYLPAQYQTTPRAVTINSDGTVTLAPAPTP